MIGRGSGVKGGEPAHAESSAEWAETDRGARKKNTLKPSHDQAG